MRIDVLTLFPSMFSPLSESIIGRAKEKGLLELHVRDIRDNATDKHRTADDTPYGGGAGMVMKAGPVIEAVSSLKNENKGARVILMTPAGRPFDQKIAERMSREKGLIIICGHYEGIDDRVRKACVDEEISIGDYVLTGGELPAMVLVDSVTRLLPGVLGDEDSSEYDSFSDGLLEGPHFTRPEDYNGMKVPKVLLNGNHSDIRMWRRRTALEKTLTDRPELFAGAQLNDGDRKLMNDIVTGSGE